MKFLLFVVSIFLLQYNILGQTRLTIKYESTNKRDNIPAQKHWNKQSILVIRDSVSYEYGFRIGKQGKMKLPLGSSFIWRSQYTNFASNLLLMQTTVYESRKYLVADTIEKISWTLVDFEKKIMGYNCKKATGIKDNKKLTVFYSPELPAYFGPFGIVGLPGTILEIWWGESLIPLTAIEIIKDAAEIVEPTDGKKISREKFNAIIKTTYRQSDVQ